MKETSVSRLWRCAALVLPVLNTDLVHVLPH